MFKTGQACNIALKREERHFSLSSRWRNARIRNEIQINQERLLKDIHYTCQWGTGPRWGSGVNDTGMSRLALTDTDRQARDWFVDTTRSLGCKVSIDAMGNIFAVRTGKKDGPPTFAGSHMDTQPSGGRYVRRASKPRRHNLPSLGWHLGSLCWCRDATGAAGEQARTRISHRCHQLDQVSDHDSYLSLVPSDPYPGLLMQIFSEEGARFPISMVASGVWAGKIPLAKAHSLQEVGGEKRNMKQELERIGYLGETEASFHAMPIGVS